MSVETRTQAPSGQMTMTLEEAIAYGVKQHQANDLDQAEQVYEIVLGLHPERIDVVNYLAIVKHQRGDLAGALALMQRVVDHAPEADGVWNNIGNVLLTLGRDEEACAAFTRSVELVETPQVWSNLARAWRRGGDLERSERACRRALVLAPDHGAATHNLALALLARRRTAEGVAAALKAMSLLPLHEQRNSIYTRLLLLAGQREQAAVILRAWLAQDPGNPYIEHHLVACLGEGAPDRASDAYVETTFDRFAESFDSTLAGVSYRAPECILDALAAVLPPPARQFDVADLGCGTGLCGPLLRPWARTLAGCDLSAQMLARARERGVYDVLHKAELTAFLDASPQAFDAVVLADTFIYFGDLRPVARALKQALRPGGRVAFSVEAAAPGEPADPVLRATGRYAHSADYVRQVFAAAGLRVEAIVGAALREEAMQPVPGWIVTAACPA